MEAPRTTPAMVGAMAALDAIAVEVSSAFEAAGIPTLLLKGASIGYWLYDSAGERLYDDVDLLVRDSQLAPAERTLRAEAFRFVHDDDHGQVWLRGPVNVDLHRRLTGIKAPPDQVFERLLADSEWLELPRGRVRVLSPPARVLTLVLHAAQHGSTWESPPRDLSRALERLPREIVEQAAALAGEFGALEAFATGLGVVPEGALLSHDLFEGLFARVGLVTDIELFEEFPARYDGPVTMQSWNRPRSATEGGSFASPRVSRHACSG